MVIINKKEIRSREISFSKRWDVESREKEMKLLVLSFCLNCIMNI